MYRKKRFFIAYDITKDKLRSKIQKKLENYGFRIQYSNYLCHFFAKDLRTVKNYCEKIIEKDDSIVWIPISDQLLNLITYQGKIINFLRKPEPKIY